MVHYARREAGLVVIKLALKPAIIEKSDLKADWQVHEGSTPRKWSVIHRMALGPGVKTPSGSRGTMTKRSTSPKLGLAVHHSKKLSYANKPPFKVSPVAQIRVDPASTEEEVHWWQRFTFELACFDTETLGYGVEDCWVEWWQNREGKDPWSAKLSSWTGGLNLKTLKILPYKMNIVDLWWEAVKAKCNSRVIIGQKRRYMEKVGLTFIASFGGGSG
ncbi:hypothetical protein EV421DRAFT_1736795 [Armillaria borealis]|uniref:Uncharacterized protein n=1 Tax=Armillaria borealis TaxID=47425 RepID=A0AA39JJ03_9AGAR|nr:hypothetical protein EV421DRAFT_1736795 [Armillaria borealis]